MKYTNLKTYSPNTAKLQHASTIEVGPNSTQVPKTSVVNPDDVVIGQSHELTGTDRLVTVVSAGMQLLAVLSPIIDVDRLLSFIF